MRPVDERQWKEKCRAVGVAGNGVPQRGHLTDKLIDKINNSVGPWKLINRSGQEVVRQ